MLAFLLIISVLLFFAFVGRAVIAAVNLRIGILWSWLLAPTVGLTTLLLLVAEFSKWEIPVHTFGGPLACVLIVLSIGVFIWRKPITPWRQLLPFVGVAVIYTVYTGWPMFRFSFNWISYANDDMANYCLAAERFLHHGYYELPLQTDLEGMDYTQHFWFMHALQQIRPGSELLLSWVCSVTGLNAHQAFMPLIINLSLVQLSALAALTLFKGRWRKLSLLATFLLSISPLFALGTLYQLIAQVGGIAMLTAAAAVVLTERRLSIRRMVIGGVIVGGLCLYYPEVAPFLAGSIIICGIRIRYGNNAVFKDYAILITGVAVITFLLLGTSTYQFLNTLILQVISSTGLAGAVSAELKALLDQGLILFPWTLVPSFIPMLFGLHPFGVVGTDPWISAVIVVGFLLLLFMVWKVIVNLKDGVPPAYIGAVMVPLGIQLFFKNQDFGLFKLAMFAQPLVAFILAQLFIKHVWGPRQKWGRIGLGLFVLLTIYPHHYYTRASVGDIGGGLSEVVGASSMGVQFTPPKDVQFDAIESDISNVVSAKMLSIYTKGIDTRFLSRSYMDNVANNAVLRFLRDPNPQLDNRGKLLEYLKFIGWMLPDIIYEGDVPDYKVLTIDAKADENNWTETSTQHLAYKNRLLVSIRRDLDHFNKYSPSTGWSHQGFYQYIMEDQAKNHLIFVHSEKGPHYYSSARFKAAFFQREPEPLTFNREYFHGTGRVNTFNVINPSKNLRMVIDFSRTSLGEGRTVLPNHAFVVGADDFPIAFKGNGSARIITEPLKPELIEGRYYLTVDFGETGQPIRKAKTGLMKLYGENLNLDDRRLVGFTRDISVISDEDYRNLVRPRRIAEFPTDLHAQKGLEYSGIYEDGWVSSDSVITLGKSNPGEMFVFKGMIPDSKIFQEQGVALTVSINGEITDHVVLKPGDFTVSHPLKGLGENTRIELNFDKTELYGSADGKKTDRRPMSALIREISITPSGATETSGQKIDSGGKTNGFKFVGIDEDGWATDKVSFQAPAIVGGKNLALTIEMPGWSPLPSNEMTVLIDGQIVKKITLPRESVQTYRISVPPGAHDIEFQTSKTFPIPNESRIRAYLLRDLRIDGPSA